MSSTINKKMAEHISEVYHKSVRGNSKLGEPQLESYTMATEGMKHFINNLCNTPTPSVFLELGAHKGGLTQSALWGNKFKKAYISDNFKYDPMGAVRFAEVEFPNIKAFLADVVKVVGERNPEQGNDVEIISADIQDMPEFEEKIDLVFFDVNYRENELRDFLINSKSSLDTFFTLAITNIGQDDRVEKLERLLAAHNYGVLYKQVETEFGTGLSGRQSVATFYLTNRASK